MKFIFGLVCLLVGISLTLGSEMCLARPPNLPKGASCGGAISCQYGLYCDPTSTCQPQIKIGGICNFNADCVPGSQCLGPIGTSTCVQNANPGETCDPTAPLNSTVPKCVSPLYCDPINSVCINGQIGDSCKQDTDCQGQLTCTGNVCTALVDNSNCTASNFCSPLSYCDMTLLKCTPKKPAGSACDFGSNECAFGTYCSKNTVTDTTYICVASYSKETAAFCYDDTECKSKRCINNYCAKDSQVTCISGGCAYGEFCGCSGILSIYGSGSCYTDPCTQKYEDFATCLSKSCSYGGTNYPGACALKNCGTQASAYAECSPAGTLSVSLFTLFFALISLWVLKN